MNKKCNSKTLFYSLVSLFVIFAMAFVVAIHTIVEAIHENNEYFARIKVFKDIMYNTCMEGHFFEQDKDKSRLFPMECSKFNMPFVKIDNGLYLVNDIFYYSPFDKNGRRIKNTPESTIIVFWEKIRNDKKQRLAMTAGFGIYDVSEDEIEKRDIKIGN